MKAMRKTIRLGTHGEQYGNWMPVSMLSLMGGGCWHWRRTCRAVFAAFHWNVLGVLFTLAAWRWRRRFAGLHGCGAICLWDGGVMEQVHQDGSLPI